MTKKTMKTLSLAILTLLSATAFAAEPPRQFGSDHDDPRTAYPSPVPQGMQACTVEVLHHGFNSFDPAKARIDAAKQCQAPGTGSCCASTAR